MCGICGIFNIGQNSDVDRAELLAMRQQLLHRGPDSQGEYLCSEVSLGIQRLKVIDLVTGDQPLFSEDKSIVLVMNGEIYNHKEIRKDLEEKRHKFSSQSDAEVIIHLYEEKGDSFLDFLNGIFALALWDSRKKRLLLARDQLGVKPLYYFNDGRRVVFASEIKAILASKINKPGINYVSLDDYLSLGYVPGERTLFSGIYRLPAGCSAKISKGRMDIARYWDIKAYPQLKIDEEEVVGELINKIRSAVRRQMVADVPVGAFLSGGIDSSLITAMLCEAANKQVKTYNVSFSGQAEYNESPFARLVSEKFNTSHRQVVMEEQICQLLPRLIWHLDEPIADQAILPTYLVSKLSRQEVTVVLSGEGGDELFAGYGHYDRSRIDWKMKIAAKFPKSFLSMTAGYYNSLPHSAMGRDFFTRYAAFAKEPFAKNFLKTSQVIFTQPDKYRLYSRNFRQQAKRKEIEAAWEAFDFGNISSYEALSQMQYLDIKYYLADDLLVKTDKMSMAVSLEARVPYLDKELVEFAIRLPGEMKFKNRIFKYMLKKASAGILPQEIVNRQKHGFEVPIKRWLNTNLGELISVYLSKKEINRGGIFNYTEIARMIKAQRSGKFDYSNKLWAILVFEIWKKIFIEKASI